MNNAAQQLITSINMPDPTLDARVDQIDATLYEIDVFMANVADLAPWQLLLTPFIPLPRDRSAEVLDDYRTVFASRDVWRDLPYGNDNIGDTDLVGQERNLRPDGSQPAGVPIAVYRDQMTVHRVFCHDIVTLESVNASLRPTHVMDMNRTDFGKKHPDPGCDLRVLPEAVHELVGARATGIWPIARGNFVVFLRYCPPCLGALFENYEIGKCEVSAPWPIG